MVETVVLRTTGAHQGLTRLGGNRPHVRTTTATDVVVVAIVVESVGTVAVRTEVAGGIRKENNQGNSSSLPLRKRKLSKKIIEDSVTFRDV